MTYSPHGRRVTVEEVYAACDEVHANGEYPSHDRVNSVFKADGLHCPYHWFRNLLKAWGEDRGVKIIGQSNMKVAPTTRRSHKSHAEQQAKPKVKRERTEWGRISRILKRIGGASP